VFRLTEPVAAVVDPQVKLGPSHAESVYLAIVLLVHLNVPFGVAVCALAAEPEALAQKLCFCGVIAGRRPQADAKYLLQDESSISR
jgi:hypothetical protein